MHFLYCYSLLVLLKFFFSCSYNSLGKMTSLNKGHGTMPFNSPYLEHQVVCWARRLSYKEDGGLALLRLVVY